MTRKKTLLATAAGTLVLLLLESPGFSQAVSNVSPNQQAAVQNETIRPFHVNIPDAASADLRWRIVATGWPDKETVADDSQGLQLATMQELARYWGKEYDWRKCEAKLNALPQFVTEIDGLDIHFIHVRSKQPSALPVILTHGWAGSIIEQMKVIGPLTDPTAFGGKPEDAFDVVIPSLPGHGFSGKPTATGWDLPRIARAWVVLMKRLGYKKFVAQGGDWGNAVSEQMALLAPPELLGISTNMAATVPADVAKALKNGDAPPASLSADERRAWDQLDDFYKNGLGYANEMANRSQTLYALADSPVGLAAWIMDHDIRSERLIARLRRLSRPRRPVERRHSRQHHPLLADEHSRLFGPSLLGQQSNGQVGLLRPQGRQDSGGRELFPDEIYAAPKTWAEKAYPKLIHYGKLEKGGHFAAWEQPELFVAELRTSFNLLR